MLLCIFCCLYAWLLFFFEWYGDHRDLHVLTHSFPTRRSSDLFAGAGATVDVVTGDVAGHQAQPGNAHGGEVVVVADLPGAFVLVTEIVDLQQVDRSEEHTSELQSLMRISYAVFCLKKKNETQL